MSNGFGLRGFRIGVPLLKMFRFLRRHGGKAPWLSSPSSAGVPAAGGTGAVDGGPLSLLSQATANAGPAGAPDPTAGVGILAAVQFKTPGDNWEKVEALDFRVKAIVKMARVWATSRGHRVITITDIDTPGIHMDNGPHYDQRAVDFRIAPLTLEEWEEFGAWVDRFLDYGRGYRAVVVGRLDSRGRHNDHAHIQVPYPYLVKGTVPLYRASEMAVTLPPMG